MAKLGMTIDLKRCMGCHTCAVGCKMQNNVPMGMLWNRILTQGGEEMDTARGDFPDLQKSWMPLACLHCENAPCVKVCPTGATFTDAEGRVLINYDRCIGCRYCMAACPYNVRVFNWQKPVRQPDFSYGDVAARPVGVMEKCSLCVERTSKGTEPRCVEVCPAKARMFGDLDDPKSGVAKAIRERGGQQLLAEKGTKPKVYYLR